MRILKSVHSVRRPFVSGRQSTAFRLRARTVGPLYVDSDQFASCERCLLGMSAGDQSPLLECYVYQRSAHCGGGGAAGFSTEFCCLLQVTSGLQVNNYRRRP